MTTNLKMKIPDSYCYDNTKNNCERYGQLATLYGGIPQDSVENRKKAYSALMNTGNAQFNAMLGGGRDLNGR
jgi:hypothetical protein